MKENKRYLELGLKLKNAREALGFSTRYISSLLPKNLSISHVTLNNYEAGKHQVPIDILSALADIYKRPINWFLEKGPVLTGIHYRNKKSKIGIRELTQFEAIAQQWLGAYQRLDEEFNSNLRKRSFGITTNETGVQAATKVREYLKLEDNPVPSVVEVMEEAGIRVIEMPIKLAIDAMAASLGKEDVVVLNSNVPNDRSRMNAAHELGHVLFRDCIVAKQELNHNFLEKRAFEFASYFLLTKKMLRNAFYGKSMVRLVKFKEQYGISLAAMIYRAADENILSKYEAKYLWIEFSKRGWRKEEPGYVKRDRATRFEQKLENAIHQKKLTWQQLSKITGVREDQLKQRLNQAIGKYVPVMSQEKGDENIRYLRINN